MISTLAICYLFAGGVGAGALVVICLVDLLILHEPFGQINPLYAAPESGIESADPRRRISARVFMCAWGLMLFGALCLLVDLGRIDRAVNLFLHPTTSILSVGAFSLLALILLGGFCAAVRFLQLDYVGRTAVVVSEVLTVPVSLVVCTYTGMLLVNMVGVALWTTWLVPVLFVLSSLSGGCAVVVLLAALTETQDPLLQSAPILVRADGLLVLAELAVTGVFLWRVTAIDNTSMHASRDLLFDLSQPSAIMWWVAFVFVGLVIPLIMEAAMLANSRDRRIREEQYGPVAASALDAYDDTHRVNLRRALGVCAAAVLIGAFALRFSIATIGQQRELELMDAADVPQEVVVPDSWGVPVPDQQDSAVPAPPVMHADEG